MVYQTDNEIKVGLRVDVDTLDGTRQGVPQLLEVFSDQGIRASYFFSVGPDNMGRHVWRLIKPAFLAKAIHSKAASLYQWTTLLRGTFWPGPKIEEYASSWIHETSESGHEVGYHAWDHHHWQANADRMSDTEIAHDLGRGISTLSKITDRSTVCSASAGWKATERVLVEKERYSFLYNSDCRGSRIFLPFINRRSLDTPQIPVTLPTYDEVIGRHGINDENYNDYLLSMITATRLNVLTIHAEVEGMSRLSLFIKFLEAAKERGIVFVPLGKLLPRNIKELPLNTIEQKPVDGREGLVCWQGERITNGARQ